MIRDLFSSCNIHSSMNKNKQHTSVYQIHFEFYKFVYCDSHKIEIAIGPVFRLFQLAMQIYAVEYPHFQFHNHRGYHISWHHQHVVGVISIDVSIFGSQCGNEW